VSDDEDDGAGVTTVLSTGEEMDDKELKERPTNTVYQDGKSLKRIYDVKEDVLPHPVSSKELHWSNKPVNAGKKKDPANIVRQVSTVPCKRKP